MDVKISLHNSPSPKWKVDVFNSLKQRNSFEVNHFQQIIDDYAKLLETNKALEEKNNTLDKEVSRLSTTNNENNRKLRTIQDQANSTQTVAELEKKVQKLQEDLTLSYKRNSDNATTMLELNQQIKVMEEDMKHKDIEIEDWKSRLQDAEEGIKRLEESVNEKDLTMQVLREELKALQIELVKNEEKVKALNAENNELINRWMLKKAEEAQKMNDAMEIAQQMIQTTAKSSLQQRAEQEGKALGELDKKGNMLDALAMLPENMQATVPTKLKKAIEGHKGDIYSVAFSYSGAIMATGGNDNLIKLWDTRSAYGSRSSLFGATQSVMSVKFAPNDETVLGASNDNIVRIWAVQQGRVRHTLTGHEGKVLTASYTADSQKVVSGSHDRTLKVWDLAKGYCIKTIFCYSSCNSLCLNTEGRMICSGHFDHHLRFWDTRGGECVQELGDIHAGQITSVSLSVDGNTILTNSRDNTLKLVDIRTYEVVKTLSDEAYRSGANWNGSCFSPDGRFVAAGGVDGRVFVWNAQSGKLEATLKSNYTNPVFSVAWNAVNLQLASVDKGGLISVWGSA